MKKVMAEMYQNAKGNKSWQKGGIVVMKGYVASHLGNEVEIPEELL